MHEAIAKLFELIQLILVLKILLSWFPNINWWEQPFKFLSDVTTPILEPFRALIPPIGGMDLSPIAAFIFLDIISGLVLRLV